MACLRCMNLVLYLSPDSILLKSGVADSAVRSIGLTDDKQSQEAGIQTHAAADATIIANSVSYLHPASESQFGDTEEMGLNFMMLCEPEEPQSELHMILSSEASSRFEEFCGPTLLASDTEPEVSSFDIVDEDVEGCNKTRYVGLVKDNHIDLEGRTTVVDRFTYDIPWLSSKRPVIPDLNAIKKALDADRKFCDRLRESGHLDSYSLSAKVRDALPPCDLNQGRFEDLYNSLKLQLRHQYYDPGDIIKLRAEFNSLKQKSGELVSDHLYTVDQYASRLRLQGDVVTDDQLYDLLCNSLMAPYNDWILAYRLQNVAYEHARMMVLSRSRSLNKQQTQSMEKTLPTLLRSPVTEVHIAKTVDTYPQESCGRMKRRLKCWPYHLNL
ncbi:hypothetical protein Pmar_PMAR006769 [Perkinsus marinus ATCC 50983]|uniref:Uncharacterized protein n=1 Tax=Perkinsus marinus (strain ATCC 50983 / TXsc) TaxID=423536 RepID=C5K6F7_PERM5|nr:hypothetical protein Pmar_PMAR006769 [Perkinsus marinus ATCC 50983]EER19877.1 hypothetical protein Pmar_PMAR006769 [Perkinsus marinus ATCC 50983]|eukprot:XP_002788081.1 hypothetical protein Pmar_PMAR006769 [Perkinsus marinus ATCC 50983]